MDLLTLLTGPVSGLLGLAGALVQKWMGMKEAKQNHEMRMAELELAARVDLQKADVLFRQTVEEKSGEAFKAAIEAQNSVKPAHAWARTFLAVFRPGLTLYLQFASTAIALIFYKEMPTMLQFVVYSMFSMSAVSLGYWFGVRTEEKFKVNAAFKPGA